MYLFYYVVESGVSGVIVAAAEINTVANEVYQHNFRSAKNINRNIESLTANEINKMKIDTILMSPPCQPFTRVGLQKDSKDNRSSSFLHVMSLIPEIRSLQCILLENVKGFEQSETRDMFVSCLVQAGFNYKEVILSPCQFGIPNTRHRYYLLAKRKGLKFCFSDSTLEHSLSPEMMECLPEDVHARLAREDTESNSKTDESSRKCYRLEHIIEKSIDDEAYLLPEKLLEKRASVLDIRTPQSRGSCCFTKAYGRYFEGTGSILCPLSSSMLTEKFSQYEKLKDNRETNYTKPLVELKLRYFTPREVSKLMCFPESFEFPNSTTNKQKYKLLGNSINVHVVSRLIYLLNRSS